MRLDGSVNLLEPFPEKPPRIATSPSAKSLRPDERQPFKERWLGRYIAYDIESFFVAITEVSTVAGYLAGCLNNPAHNPRFADIGYALGGNMCGTASPSRLTEFVLRTRY
ncbi:MAG: hypothetical protein WAV38_18920 [Xanthobacteraceae bacterium]